MKSKQIEEFNNSDLQPEDNDIKFIYEDDQENDNDSEIKQQMIMNKMKKDYWNWNTRDWSKLLKNQGRYRANRRKYRNNQLRRTNIEEFLQFLHLYTEEIEEPVEETIKDKTIEQSSEEPTQEQDSKGWNWNIRAPKKKTLMN